MGGLEEAETTGTGVVVRAGAAGREGVQRTGSGADMFGRALRVGLGVLGVGEGVRRGAQVTGPHRGAVSGAEWCGTTSITPPVRVAAPTSAPNAEYG